jgi:hypothetical protein
MTKHARLNSAALDVYPAGTSLAIDVIPRSQLYMRRLERGLLVAIISGFQGLGSDLLQLDRRRIFGSLQRGTELALKKWRNIPPSSYSVLIYRSVETAFTFIKRQGRVTGSESLPKIWRRGGVWGALLHAGSSDCIRRIYPRVHSSLV